MSQVCKHADIQDKPCSGSVFSREITCKAGRPNTCLKRCGPSCPSYVAEEYKPEPIPKGNTPAPHPEQVMRVGSQASKQVFHRTTKSGGCGSCGGRR